jgi:pilus assembly protein CpaB
MSPVRMGGLISVALAAAIGFALVARGLTSAHEPRPVMAVGPSAPSRPMVRVLVAKHDLQPGDKLTQGDFVWQAWPKEDLNPAYVTDGATDAPAPDKAPATVKIQTAAMKAASDQTREIINGAGPAARMIDAVVHDPILQGEPITDRKVVRAGTAGVMAASLDPGMRAMAVPLSAESAAGGFILPGDHVDVVQSRQIDVPGGTKRFATGAVLRNVKVLAIDQNTRSQKQTTAIGATATLEVTPDEAELLVLAKAQGELTLTLRSYADMAGSASAGEGSSDRHQMATVVKVFRNGVPSEVTVSQ